MTTHLALILLACLSVTLTATLCFLLLARSRSSRTPSPTPISTPPTLSVDPVVTLTTKMMEMMEKEATENRKLMETLMLGREQTAPTPMSMPSLSEVLKEYDPDSTPLSPGIEAILAREVEEDEQLRLMKERAALQERLREDTLRLQQMERQSESEDFLPGPWQVPEASEYGSPT